MIPLADPHENWMPMKNAEKNQSSSISERKRARSYHYVFRPVGHQELFQMQNSKGKPGGNAKSASETNILNHLICCYYLYTAIFNRFITSVLADFITSVLPQPPCACHTRWRVHTSASRHVAYQKVRFLCCCCQHQHRTKT